MARLEYKLDPKKLMAKFSLLNRCTADLPTYVAGAAFKLELLLKEFWYIVTTLQSKVDGEILTPK